MAKIVFHGQSCIELVAANGTRILVDPFLTGNPRADVEASHFEDRLDYVLLTHGHGDHTADAWDLLTRTEATLVGTYEIVTYAGEVHGIENAHPMHIGGGWDFPFGRVKMTIALHGGKIDGPNAAGYTTQPAGFVVELDGTRVYLAGDTALTRDMELLRDQVDVALLPIGDNFTMGPEDAARAVDMIRPNIAIPIHYGTWEMIDVDPNRFVRAVGDLAEVRVLEPGDALNL